jgi:hypothetical protein
MGDKRMYKEVAKFITVTLIMLIAASQFALLLQR